MKQLMIEYHHDHKTKGIPLFFISLMNTTLEETAYLLRSPTNARHLLTY